MKPTTPGRYRYTDPGARPRICNVSVRDGVLWAEVLDPSGHEGEFFLVSEMTGDFEGPLP